MERKRLLKAEILAFFKGPGAKERKQVWTDEYHRLFGPGAWDAFHYAVVAGLNKALAGQPGWEPVVPSQLTHGTANAVAFKLDQRR